MIKVGELYDWGWEAVVVSNYLFMKCNKNKCFRRKYFETSKNRGCGNIFPHSKKMLVQIVVFRLKFYLRMEFCMKAAFTVGGRSGRVQ